jgi:hypothetical protein
VSATEPKEDKILERVFRTMMLSDAAASVALDKDENGQSMTKHAVPVHVFYWSGNGEVEMRTDLLESSEADRITGCLQ